MKMTIFGGLSQFHFCQNSFLSFVFFHFRLKACYFQP